MPLSIEDGERLERMLNAQTVAIQQYIDSKIEEITMALEESVNRIVTASQTEIQQLKDAIAGQATALSQLADAVAGQQAAEQLVAQLQESNTALQNQADTAISNLDSASAALEADDPAAPTA